MHFNKDATKHGHQNEENDTGKCNRPIGLQRLLTRKYTSEIVHRPSMGRTADNTTVRLLESSVSFIGVIYTVNISDGLAI